MANVVQQYGYSRIEGFLLTDVHPLDLQGMDGLVHQVHGPYRMLVTGMQGTRINRVCHAQLPDPSQSLKPGMLDEIKQQGISHCDKAVDRIVKDFSAVEGGMPH